MCVLVSPGEKNPALRVTGDIIEIYRQMILRQPWSSALGPLDQNQSARDEDVVPAKIGELIRRLYPVEIDVKHRRPRRRIFLDQRVGRAGDRVGVLDTVADADGLCERRFAYP